MLKHALNAGLGECTRSLGRYNSVARWDTKYGNGAWLLGSQHQSMEADYA